MLFINLELQRLQLVLSQNSGGNDSKLLVHGMILITLTTFAVCRLQIVLQSSWRLGHSGHEKDEQRASEQILHPGYLRQRPMERLH